MYVVMRRVFSGHMVLPLPMPRARWAPLAVGFVLTSQNPRRSSPIQ